MAAFASWACIKAKRLSEWADVIAAMSLEAYDGRIDAFNLAVHMVRPHLGQLATARHLNALLRGSELIAQPKVNVQDPYSFRCIPQVHGAVKDTVSYVKSVIDVEINATTDNPTVCPDEDLIISAGNFHGEPIALPIDFLALALSELSSISERRIYKLVSGTRGLPSFLVAKGTKLHRIVLNTERVLAIELLNAAQALEFRRPLKSSPVIERIFADYRQVVPFIEEDEVMYPHIAKSVEFLRSESIE